MNWGSNKQDMFPFDLMSNVSFPTSSSFTFVCTPNSHFHIFLDLIWLAMGFKIQLINVFVRGLKWLEKQIMRWCHISYFFICDYGSNCGNWKQSLRNFFQVSKMSNVFDHATKNKDSTSGVRTHEDIRPLELKSNALTTRPSCCTAALVEIRCLHLIIIFHKCISSAKWRVWTYNNTNKHLLIKRTLQFLQIKMQIAGVGRLVWSKELNTQKMKRNYLLQNWKKNWNIIFRMAEFKNLKGVNTLLASRDRLKRKILRVFNYLQTGENLRRSLFQVEKERVRAWSKEIETLNSKMYDTSVKADIHLTRSGYFNK